MGLFDLFSRKAKKSPAPSPAETPNAPAPPPALATPSGPEPDPRLSPWQQSVWRAEQSPAFAWSDENGSLLPLDEAIPELKRQRKGTQT